EAVPLGHALQRHHDPVVGSAVALHRDDLGRRARRVAAVPEHRVDRVEALPRAALRPLALERYAQREHFPGGRQTAGRGDRVGCDEVQGADLVVGPPPPPVPHLHRELAKRFLAHGRQSYANRARPSVNMSDVTARTDRLLLANAIMGQFLTGVATRIFIVALPTLAVALDTDIIAISWALIVYQLAGISLSVVFGRLGDIHGRYAIYGLGFAIMTVSFVLCGLAPNAFLLIVFRLVQGLGAAMISSATRVLAMESMPEGSEGRANGYMTMGFHSGLLIGPPLGGLVIDLLDWRWIFFLMAPLGLAGVVLTVLRARKPRTAAPARRAPSIDYLGAVLLVPLTVMLSLLLDRRSVDALGAERTAVIFVIFGATLVGFLAHERRAISPVVNLALFSIRMFTFSVLSLLLIATTISVMSFLMPF